MKELFKLKETPAQIALVQAIGSKNVTVSMEAQQALAAFLGPVVQKVLKTKGTVSAIYDDLPYDQDDSPSFPLDLYYGEIDGYVTVWSQQNDGGLPSNQTTGNAELKFMTYALNSAVSWNKRYARKSRLDVVSASIARMINEVLIKQEKNGWAVILKSLAEASTKPRTGSNLTHAIRCNTAGSFLLADLNDLLVRHVRLNESYSGNTPDDVYSSGPTDLYVSPEIKGKIRAFAYNPMNTNAGPIGVGGTPAASTFGIPLPEAMRSEIYKGGGLQNIYGINIVQMNELGVGKKYNVLFDNFATAAAQTYARLDGTTTNNAFANATEEIMIGIDNSRGAYKRPVSRDSENGGAQFTVLPDDQWNLSRLDKAGFYGSLEEGRVSLDARSTSGLIS